MAQASSFALCRACTFTGACLAHDDRKHGATMLSNADFLTVVRLTPLVAIDLIVTDGNRRILLGHRRNRPAQGTWFVPGGRITKNESLDAAFKRIVHNELGVASAQRSAARFFGVYEHLYDDNFIAENGVGTHYVVLVYSMELDSNAPVGRYDQHSQYVWFTPEELLTHPDVHENTKIYFR
jgi:colanic acid biosynthesis protein WcaH